MPIIGWDFEDVDVSGGPVSSWVLSSEFAARGVMAIGWPETSPGVFVGHTFGPWSGGNVLFASPSEDGSSVLAIILYEPSPLTLAFPTTTGPTPTFEVSGRLRGQEVFRIAVAGSEDPQAARKIDLPVVSAFTVSSGGGAIPVEGYVLPAPAVISAFALTVAFLLAKRRSAGCGRRTGP